MTCFFFFIDTRTSETYTTYLPLSLHDALPISCLAVVVLKLNFTTMEAGALVYRERGVAIDDETLEAAGAADAVLLGAMGLPEVRYPDGREISPQVDLRELCGLFAGVRPIRAIAGAPLPLAAIGRASCRERVCPYV